MLIISININSAVFSLYDLFKDLFSESFERVGVMFASIPDFTDYYEKKEMIHQDVECLRLLNEIVGDFDEVRKFKGAMCSF